MKRIISILLTIVLVSVMVSSVSAADAEKIRLSDLSEEECIAFLKEKGVEIPPVFEDDTTWGYFVHSVIEQIEENPNIHFPYDNAMMLDFVNDIKAVVNQYYAVSGISVCEAYYGDRDILKDNIVVGSWNAAYFEYNSYAYAIGKTENLEPGISVWLSNGHDSDDYVFDCCASIETIINWIELDLEYFGNTVNAIATTMPDTEVDAHTHLICFRQDVDGMPWYFDDEGLQYYHEYYFMKLGDDGKWYHKPAGSIPFQYKYTPSNSRVWVYEYCEADDYCIRDSEWTHEGEIWYVEYTTPHVYVYRTCGGDKHINTCTICGGTTGSAMACVFVNDKCKICGYIKIESGGLRTSIVPAEDVAA